MSVRRYLSSADREQHTQRTSLSAVDVMAPLVLYTANSGVRKQQRQTVWLRCGEKWFKMDFNSSYNTDRHLLVGASPDISRSSTLLELPTATKILADVRDCVQCYIFCCVESKGVTRNNKYWRWLVRPYEESFCFRVSLNTGILNLTVVLWLGISSVLFYET